MFFSTFKFQARVVAFSIAGWAALSTGAFAADVAKIRSFLKITGFDVAITSMQQGAMAGPAITGEDPERFGRQWSGLAEQVFDPEGMLNDAVEMLEAVLPDELLDHGMAFYGSDLGQRIVALENESHMADDEAKYSEGEEIVVKLMEEQNMRVELFRAMSEAIGSTDTSIKSLVEIQVRYLMAAIAANASELSLSEEDLRAVLNRSLEGMRNDIEVNTLIVNAYSYSDLTDEELIDYLAALQDPKMGDVYEILNAVQFEIMGERYETLAARLSELQPEQEL